MSKFGQNMVKIGSNFDNSQVSAIVTLPCHASYVNSNARLQLLYVLTSRSWVILNALRAIGCQNPLYGRRLKGTPGVRISCYIEW